MRGTETAVGHMDVGVAAGAIARVELGATLQHAGFRQNIALIHFILDFIILFLNLSYQLQILQPLIIKYINNLVV